ncbi:helix-turn-helix domain-containing protein [Roseomonas marmotae]|uniref:Helix-turn-helix transcriptional regulator n=1 Tax=Roseomonas marmotae TaxID=2768161 RepID=A0ABS3K8I8_9PROT|nr:helix-turn-helix transcriptional regulator [Roseomonas marmotae]MBO1073322.1 helix-turn-helix transcriptional regulator [Roseomonas marmotae]QTI79061.1 helix-turn-helix transcriptional regulator [Roseomonas marmotae]
MEIDIPPMAERIVSRLDRLGIDPAEAFRQAGLPEDFLERLRAGKAPVPRGQRLVRLAEALGTSVSYLVGLDPDVQPPQELLEEEQASLGLLAGDEEALLRAYRRLDVPGRAALLQVVTRMAGPEPDQPARAPARGRRIG